MLIRNNGLLACRKSSGTFSIFGAEFAHNNFAVGPCTGSYQYITYGSDHSMSMKSRLDSVVAMLGEDE